MRAEPSTGARSRPWNSLFRGLESLFGERRYHRAHTLVGLDQDADGVDLRFAEGAERRFDLVVCADGVSSVGRRRLFGVEPCYCGYVGWRGICGRDELAPATWDVLDETFTYVLLDHEHVVAYPIPTTGREIHVTGRRVNFTWYRNVAAGPHYDELMTDSAGIPRPLSVPGGQVQDRLVQQRRADAARRLPEPIADLVTAAKEPFVTAIADADCHALRAGRVCLVGDAAITARPHAAAGSAKAAADAWDLAEHLADINATGVPAALERWEPGALVRGRSLLCRTRDMGSRLQGSPGAWNPADPSNRFGLSAHVEVG